MTDSTLNWEAEQRLGRIEEKLGLTWPPEEESSPEESESDESGSWS